MSRRRFEVSLAGVLDERLGLGLVPGPSGDGMSRIFWVQFENLVLEVALIYHRFYAATYTFDLYLGRTFTFALAAPDYPAFASGRFTKFIDAAPSFDGFFTGYTGEVVESAAAAVEAAVAGYIAQPGLAAAVREVRLLKVIRDLDVAIVETVGRADKPASEILRLQPKPGRSSLPPEWYVAAERTLVAGERTLGYPVNANHVRMYALDAWRCAKTSIIDWI